MAQNTNCGPYFIFFPEFLPDTTKVPQAPTLKYFAKRY
jgi:hypothetical protein